MFKIIYVILLFGIFISFYIGFGDIVYIKYSKKENGKIYTIKKYYGVTLWYLGKEIHRENGPAIIWKNRNGRKEWYRNSKLHREDGPAIEEHGFEIWFKHDNQHRTDGPSTLYYSSGNKEYWLDGKQYWDIQSDEEWIIFNIIT
jgi:hypothetical protein